MIKIDINIASHKKQQIFTKFKKYIFVIMKQAFLSHFQHQPQGSDKVKLLPTSLGIIQEFFIGSIFCHKYDHA